MTHWCDTCSTAHGEASGLCKENTDQLRQRAEQAEKLAEERLWKVDDWRNTAEQAGAVVEALVRVAGWSDGSNTHALLHVENLVNNLRADVAAVADERDAFKARVEDLREERDDCGDTLLELEEVSARKEDRLDALKAQLSHVKGQAARDARARKTATALVREKVETIRALKARVEESEKANRDHQATILRRGDQVAELDRLYQAALRDKQRCCTPIKTRLGERIAELEAALEPVRDWYDGDGERTDAAAMLRDAIADLQTDRAAGAVLEGALRDARGAIDSLDALALGVGQDGDTVWPTKLEVLHNIDKALGDEPEATSSRDPEG